MQTRPPRDGDTRQELEATPYASSDRRGADWDGRDGYRPGRPLRKGCGGAAALARLNVCKAIADRAAALTEYAAQAKDTRLHRAFARVRARVIRRLGQLIVEVADARAGRPQKMSAKRRTYSRVEVGKQAGLRQYQVLTTVRLARLSEEEFEAKVESAHPPTIHRICEGRDPES